MRFIHQTESSLILKNNNTTIGEPLMKGTAQYDYIFIKIGCFVKKYIVTLLKAADLK
jgi:hypothetical protein